MPRYTAWSAEEQARSTGLRWESQWRALGGAVETFCVLCGYIDVVWPVPCRPSDLRLIDHPVRVVARG
eukprot:scaffold2185_cov57-Phaeocystis_antarctica.AAC.1